MRTVLRRRDIGAVFRLVQCYGGVSQSRLAVATGLLQGRISEIIKGTRLVTSLEVFERIADGLDMPDEARIMLGLAPLHPVGLEHLGPAGRAEVIAIYSSQQEAATEIRESARRGVPRTREAA